ncbi:MAG: hypothetical protein FWG40_00790 [Peptococcaceae bacterium]|nr:hypothetical protein [Peptococcaceae bacterium]
MTKLDALDMIRSAKTIREICRDAVFRWSCEGCPFLDSSVPECMIVSANSPAGWDIAWMRKQGEEIEDQGIPFAELVEEDQ